MANLVIVRHGQSQWNLEDRFTGWVDVDLSPQGEQEAIQAGKIIKQAGFQFAAAFSSVLKRANRTLDFILQEIGQTDIPVYKDIALNERHYGALQGLNKKEMIAKHGEEQVKIWRRSYDVPPPKDVTELNPDGISESLKDTAARSIPYYQKHIEPLLKEGKDVLIVAHGNSLRSLMMHIEKMTKEEILETNLDTAKPRLYVFDSQMNVIEKRYL
ncbi:MAG: 2,3-bisphosphoglycerate-dependent phosphoglycerate mutase [Cytophagales bacterium]|nr:2,3-bisphosphoglycerate-dependent phosphoglycerate mutase [Cytophagales bacterium]MDW8385319.1 2,3-bisphosphoglycerate-dependent phosphoglycerate mutase [Flammeovirgaceae bacterium]